MTSRVFPGSSLARMVAVFFLRRGYIWMPSYFRDRFRKRRARLKTAETLDLIVCVADHFEPARWRGEEAQHDVAEWCALYEALAKDYTDSHGRHFQHTWFYRYDFPDPKCLDRLAESVFSGFGEVEFHLHHGYDTPSEFSRKIDEGLRWFSGFGAMITAESEPRRRFGYIAGDWALDNGRRDPAVSGVNTELQILGRYGCFADFTFPAYGHLSQPRIVNSIYHAYDSPKPKSYDKGTAYRAGKPGAGDLTIFEGPLYIDPSNGAVETSALEDARPYFSDRLDYWRKAHVHVEGRPEWVFIKLHTHGMQSKNSFLGSSTRQMLNDLDALKKNPNLRIHYVTAREAYNIARAAEAGHSGDPNEFRNYEVPPPIGRFIRCNSTIRSVKYAPEHLTVQVEPLKQGNSIRLRNWPIAGVEGPELSELSLIKTSEDQWILTVKSSGNCYCVRTDSSDASKPDMFRDKLLINCNPSD